MTRPHIYSCADNHRVTKEALRSTWNHLALKLLRVYSNPAAARAYLKNLRGSAISLQGSALKRYFMPHNNTLSLSYFGPQWAILIAVLYGVLSFDYNNPSQTWVNDVGLQRETVFMPQLF